MKKKTRHDTKNPKPTRTKVAFVPKDFHLEGRTHSKKPLAFHSTYKSFSAALKKGQDLFGYGMFHIDCGLYVPAREEQLGSTSHLRLELLASL